MGGGRFQELIIGSKIFLIRMLSSDCRDPCTNDDAVFSQSQLIVNFAIINLVFSIEKLMFLALII